MIENEIVAAVKKKECAEEFLKRIKSLCEHVLFQDCQRPLFVEIGGPSAHIRALILTKTERDQLKDFFTGLFELRRQDAERDYIKSCKAVAAKNGQEGK